jgi:hypothetical protein
MMVAPNSPIALVHVIIIPEITARPAIGSVTVKNTRSREPDKIFALLTTFWSTFSTPALAEVKMNGDATNICANMTANTLPGKIIPSGV